MLGASSRILEVARLPYSEKAAVTQVAREQCGAPPEGLQALRSHVAVAGRVAQEQSVRVWRCSNAFYAALAHLKRRAC